MPDLYAIGISVQLIRHLSQKLSQPCVLTVGNFDGVHIGHQAMLTQLQKMALAAHLPAVVMIFEPQPQEFFQRDKAPARLSAFREKVNLLKQYAPDSLVCLRFNAALAQLSAHDFIQQILIQQLKAQHLIVGDDFRFGQGRQGDVTLLQQSGLQVTCIPTHQVAGERVSSSRIRALLEAGDFEAAHLCLGRSYTLSGRVIKGQQMGRTLGFATANIQLKQAKVVLAGVYVVEVLGFGAQVLTGVANIGMRPTVGGTRLSLEVHLFNFNQNIYGHRLSVRFLHKLRAEQRFASLEALKAQIAKDVQAAQNYFISRV